MMKKYKDTFQMNSNNITNQIVAYEEKYTFNLVIPLTITNTVIFIVGILGNMCTCVVIARNRSMHMVTNFYLFSLAISDLTFLVCGVPFELYKLWNPTTYPLGDGICIATGLATETSVNAAVMLITTFTVEKYFVICRPFMVHTMTTLSRVVRLIIGIWICAVLTAVPVALQFGVVSFMENGQTVRSCTVKEDGVFEVFVISSFIFFGLPMSVISVLYALICIKLRTSRVLHQVMRTSVDSIERALQLQNRNSASQKRIIRMLVAVALSFFLCWAPFHVQRLIAIYGKNFENATYTYYMAYVVLAFFSGTLCYLSTAINPLLYSIMSKKFKNAFMMTLASWCGANNGGRSPRLRRTSTLIADVHTITATTISRARAYPSRYSRRLRGFTDAATQYEAPARAQCCTERELLPVLESRRGHGQCRQDRQLCKPVESSCSISNSSLLEVDEELTSEELATYMYHVNCDIVRHDSSKNLNI